jgi:hypothetical protein
MNRTAHGRPESATKNPEAVMSRMSERNRFLRHGPQVAGMIRAFPLDLPLRLMSKGWL